MTEMESELAIVLEETAGLRVEASTFYDAASCDEYTDDQRTSLRHSANNMLYTAIATERQAMGLPKLPD